MPRPFLQLLLALVLGLAASYYWEPQAGKAPDPETTARQKSLPKNYLDNTRTWSYNEQGQLTEIMEAANAEHFPQRNESLLEEPRFYSHHGDDRTWTAKATRGKFLHKKQLLILRGGVEMVNDQTQAKLASDAMTLNLVKKTAASRVPVMVTKGPHHTRADGMLANLDSEKIRFIQNVESVYVQPQP
ncbi:MAG: LPS export ABC transporter periplasmic protein LptC [Halieaceae bacterium]